MSHEKCKGCSVWDKRYNNLLTPKCRFKSKINGISCPCLICLLKMLCVKPCEKFDNYIKPLE